MTRVWNPAVAHSITYNCVVLFASSIEAARLGRRATDQNANTTRVPPAGDFVGRELSLSVLLEPGALFAFVLLVIGVVLLSGLYPAFVLANFKPARIFQPGGKRGGLSLRSVLVIFQFVTSIALMVLAGTVWQQVRYL